MERQGRGLMLQLCCDRAQLSLHDVERLSGIPAMTVRRFENGVQVPEPGELKRLCALYTVPENWRPSIGAA